MILRLVLLASVVLGLTSAVSASSNIAYVCAYQNGESQVRWATDSFSGKAELIEADLRSVCTEGFEVQEFQAAFSGVANRCSGCCSRLGLEDWWCQADETRCEVNTFRCIWK